MQNTSSSKKSNFGETPNYSLQKIRLLVLGDNLEIKKELQQVDIFLKWELAGQQKHTERHLETLFYALVIKLRLFSIETPGMEKLFHTFLWEMDVLMHKITKSATLDGDLIQAIKKWWLKLNIFNYYESIDMRINMLGNKIHLNQMLAFLYVCENYVHLLERYYKEMGASSRVLQLYIIRMNIKRKRYFLKKNYWLFLGFELFRIISTYGTSFVRLSITCTLSVVLFAGIYWMADYFAPENVRMIASLQDYSSYFFNALVTISGLGIDASPQTALQRFAMGTNTIYGMVVFGMLFNVISTKLSMNS